jgi:predicted DNA-binding WGR domain protein
MNFRFIGWCKQGSADKVWGVINLIDDQVLTVWGRRGAKLQTKVGPYDWSLSRLISKKEEKGYRSIDENELNQVYPEFQSDLEKTAIWATLKL